MGPVFLFGQEFFVLFHLRFWKERLIDWMNPKKDDHLIDIASGTGDIAKAFLKRIQFSLFIHSHLKLG